MVETIENIFKAGEQFQQLERRNIETPEPAEQADLGGKSLAYIEQNPENDFFAKINIIRNLSNESATIPQFSFVVNWGEVTELSSYAHGYNAKSFPVNAEFSAPLENFYFNQEIGEYLPVFLQGQLIAEIENDVCKNILSENPASDNKPQGLFFGKAAQALEDFSAVISLGTAQRKSAKRKNLWVIGIDAKDFILKNCGDPSIFDRSTFLGDNYVITENIAPRAVAVLDPSKLFVFQFGKYWARLDTTTKAFEGKASIFVNSSWGWGYGTNALQYGKVKE